MQKLISVKNGERTIWNLKEEGFSAIRIVKISAKIMEELTNPFHYVTKFEDESTVSRPFLPSTSRNIYIKVDNISFPNKLLFNCDISTIEIEPKHSPNADYIIEYEVMSRFFSEFIFKSPLTEIYYWLPLFLNTNDRAKALKLAQAVKVGLEEQYADVKLHSCLPESILTNAHIRHAFNTKRYLHKNILEMNVWDFTCVEAIPEIGFNANLQLVTDNLPFDADTIATRIFYHQYPVRILRNNPLVDFKELLFVDVVKS